MKTFEDLEFNERYEESKSRHVSAESRKSTRAFMDLNNGYAVSVITGPHTYGTEAEPYEVAIYRHGNFWTHDTPFNDYIIGWCDKEKVTTIMKMLQAL